MKRDIINLTRLGSDDGGAQTAASFLQRLAERRDPKNYCVVSVAGTRVGDLCAELGFGGFQIGDRIQDKARLDLSCRRFFERGQLCFTFHGVPWLRSQGYLTNLCGAADSNLYYPEIDFWRHAKTTARVRKALKDRARMYGYSRSDYWVFETETLADRAVALANYPADRVAVVKMSASAFVSPEKVEAATRERFRRQIGDGMALLFMAGPNPNKRIHCVVPALARRHRESPKAGAIKVVTTLPTASAYYHELERAFRAAGLRDHWVNLGPVAYHDIPSRIDSCDVVCLFSVLESFSSNITEAWAMQKPLLASNVDWARAACGDAALYVAPDDPASVSDALAALADPETSKRLLDRSASQFQRYPSPEDRCEQFLECMETARHLGPLTKRTAVRKLRSAPVEA